MVGVAGVLGDEEGEGDVGGAAGLGSGPCLAAGGEEARAVGGAVGQVAVAWDREVDREVGKIGVDLEG